MRKATAAATGAHQTWWLRQTDLRLYVSFLGFRFASWRSSLKPKPLSPKPLNPFTVIGSRKACRCQGHNFYYRYSLNPTFFWFTGGLEQFFSALGFRVYGFLQEPCNPKPLRRLQVCCESLYIQVLHRHSGSREPNAPKLRNIP